MMSRAVVFFFAVLAFASSLVFAGEPRPLSIAHHLHH